MLTLFFNLYFGMFIGNWPNYTFGEAIQKIKPILNGLGTFLTSIFGDNQMTTLGDSLFPTLNINDSVIALVSLALALITSIGIVVMAVKGVKKAFGIFFGQIR